MYTQRLKPLIAISFILGPVLMLISSLFAGLVLYNKPWFGIFGQFGAILLIPIGLTLAWMIGQSRPRFGVICASIGLVGSAMAVSGYGQHLAFGLLEMLLVDFQANTTMEQLIGAMIPEQLIGGLPALLFPLSYILYGIGVWISGSASRLTAVLLALGGLAFFLGQGVGEVGEVISPVLMSLALIPIGWRMLTADKNDVVFAPMTATS